MISKKALRCLGVAESFQKEKLDKSVIAGVVMRRDLVIDGFSSTLATVGGLDATESILRLYRKLQRTDINFMILEGVIISFYNIIDLKRLYEELSIPLIAVTYRESKGRIIDRLKSLPDGEKRLRIYEKNGPREKIFLKTGYNVYIRFLGLKREEAVNLLNVFTLRGRVPEPVRVAGLIARGILRLLIDIGDLIGFRH